MINRFARLFRGPGMQACFGTKNFLAATTAMTTVFLPAVSLGVGLVAFPTGEALADDPISIPLEYVGEGHDRLGIWAKINNGNAQRYVFDTGSDQLNTQIGSEVTGVRPIADTPYVYTYGDGTYGNKLQNVEIDKFTYVDPDQKITIDGPSVSDKKYRAARILDFVYTHAYCKDNNLKCTPGSVTDGLKDMYGQDLQEPYHADKEQRAKMTAGKMADEGGDFAGTFGAGDFLGKTSVWGMMGSVTRSGYVVSANVNPDSESDQTPGCSPCTIVNLNPSLRAQYTNAMPWGEPEEKDQDSYQNFPGSGANASTEYEGSYNLQYTVKDGAPPITDPNKTAVLLDTGTPGGGSLEISDAMLKQFQDAGVKLKNVRRNEQREIVSASGNIPSVTIAGTDGDPVRLDNIDFTYTSGTTEQPNDQTSFVAGLDFFKNRSVIFDLEKKYTAYTSHFVTASNFSTDSSAPEGTGLSRITTSMGNEGGFGIAGVVSGSGSLTLDTKTVVRMTNVNTYTGETNIAQDAYLSLAGLGNIQRSAKVVADGTFDISEHGNGSDYWGISDAYNDARIRSLSGSGTVELGKRTLVLTASNDTFAGSINDLDVDNNNMGGKLFVAGGVQTLSGKNNFSGMTTVGSGAGLLLADTGVLSHDATTSGFLGNDGQIGGTAIANSGGVVAGGGTYGAVTISEGGTVAPGSATDPSRIVTTLTVTGDFAQQSGSIYQVDLARSSDLIDVGGAAAIDSGAQIELLRQRTLSVDARYTLLSAAGGVSGTYGGLTGALATDATPFVDFQLVYDANNVYLDISRTSTAFADVASTFNQRSVAAAAQALGSGNPIQDNILFLTAPEARNAFDMLSGEVHASIHSGLIEDSHSVRDAASERIRAAFDGVGASSVPVMTYGLGGLELAPATSENFAVWGRGFGAWGHLDSDGNAAGLDHSTGGFLAGGDAAVGESWRLGLISGYSHTSLEADDRASSGSSENYHLGLFAGTQNGNLGFRSGLAYTWHSIETGRSVVFPGFADSLSADYDAGTFQAFGELGYRINTASASFEPYANLAYVNFDADGFTENGGAAALSSGDRSSDTAFTTLGLRASTVLTLGTVTATARGGLGWRHAFGDVRPDTALAFAGGSSFAITGVPIAKNAALLEAGLDVNITENATFGIAYQGQIASDAQTHGFSAKLGVRF